MSERTADELLAEGVAMVRLGLMKLAEAVAPPPTSIVLPDVLLGDQVPP
jgi:hypothetical protein